MIPEEFNPQIFYYVSKRCDPSWCLSPPAPISFYDLTFVLRGEATYWVNEVPYTVHAGEAVFIPQGSMRAAQTPGMDCVAFNFFSDLNLNDVLPSISIFQDCGAVRYWLREFNRAWLTAKGGINGKAAFLMLFWELCQWNREEPVNPHVEKMKQYMADHVALPFSLEAMADSVHLHPVYCESLFRAFAACSPARYHTGLRMEQAAVLLTYEDFPVSYIANQLGYEDTSYFSRVFKKIKGITPKEYRSMYGGL